jgi:hypothetical protein
MSDANLFGPIVTGDDVERAIAAFLRDPQPNGHSWLDTYLGELERHAGYAPGQIQRPKGVVTRSELETWPEDQLPVIVVVSPALAARPSQRAGAYQATWAVAVAPVVSDVDEPGTRRLSHTYVAAVRLAMLQHGSLGGFAESVEWIDERTDDTAFADTRSIMAGRVVFEVTVGNVARRSDGPLVPLPDPAVDPGPWPDVSATPVDVSIVPITEEVPHG